MTTGYIAISLNDADDELAKLKRHATRNNINDL